MALSETCLWASLNDLKPYVRLTAFDVDHDDMLALRAEAVTQELERETGRIFVSRTITGERHTGTGGTRLELRYYPVTSIASLTEDEVAVDSDDYVLDGARGVLTRLGGQTWSTLAAGNIRCTYVAGYARDDATLADVKLLAIELLRARYLTWGTGSDVFPSQQINGVGSFSPSADWISIRKKLESLATAVRVGGLRVAGA